jgi:hypothetical protein
MFLNVFFIALHTKLDISHPLVLGVSHCIYNQPLDPMGIHFLCYAHGEEGSISHDILRDVFVGIAKDVRFHILQ